MTNSYYATYVDGHHGSLDRIGGASTHLPLSLPECSCRQTMTFLAQIYFEGKDLDFVTPDLIAIQLYSCFKCYEDTVAEITNASELNKTGSGEYTPDCQDITWVLKSDPEPTADTGQYWDDGEILPDHEHLLYDKIGGCFPTVDHGGTSSFELGIVGQLTIFDTVYLTKNENHWGFFRH